VRLPFPTRVSLAHIALYAAAMFLVQQVQHTSLAFSVLYFGFVLLAAVTFNVAGGFARPAGAYVFWFALLTVMLGVTWKAVLREPADSNIDAPVLTMAAYAGGMVSMLIAMLISRALLAGRRSLSEVLHANRIDLGDAAIGCLAAGVAITALNLLGLGGGSGTPLAALNQVNFFLPIAILLGTVHVIRSSGGRKVIDLPTGLAILLNFFFGLIAFSKQGIFTPLLSWLVAACACRLKLRLSWALPAALILFFTVLWGVPIAQVGREYAENATGTAQRIRIVANLLFNIGTVRSDYEADVPEPDASLNTRGFYFDSNQGLLDRLTMMPVDSALIGYSSRGHYDGLGPIRFAFENWLPHFIAPHKEQDAVGGGNAYAHEVGNFLAPDDFATGVSFSPVAEAFHLEGWWGIFLLAPALWVMLFTVLDFLTGDPRRAPWGLFLTVAYAHVAPESLLIGMIQFVWSGSIGILVVMVFCVRVAPVLGAVLTGRARDLGPGPAALPLAPRLR